MYQRFKILLFLLGSFFLLSSVKAQQFIKNTSDQMTTAGRNSFSSLWADYNNDGLLDCFSANTDPVNTPAGAFNPNSDFLFLNLFTPPNNILFQRITASNPIVIDNLPTRSGAWGDIDNDGFLDLFVGVTNGTNTNRIYRNNLPNPLQFQLNPSLTTQITVDAAAATFGGVWGDYNNDGLLDLFVNNFFNQANYLYRQSAGSFTKVTAGVVVTENFSSSSANWVDYDNDNDLDLFICNFAPNSLFRNDGSNILTRVSTGTLVTENFNSSGASWGDYDNDGDLDVFVANYDPGSLTDASSLFRNDGGGNFTRITTAGTINTNTLSTYGSAWGDYDNDGWLDLLITNDAGQLNRLYRNNGNGTFSEISNEITTDATNLADRQSRGCSFIDINNDGRLDVFIAQSHASNAGENEALYINNISNANSWFEVNLTGNTTPVLYSNWAAIGAKVFVRTGGVTRMRVVEGNSGYMSQNGLQQHFGLGNATQIDSVRIIWPSGIVQRLGNYTPNQNVSITETPPSAVFNTPTVTDGEAIRGTNNHILYAFNFTLNNADARLANMQFSTGGTYASSDLQANSFKLWVSTTNNFATATQIGTQNIVASGGNFNFAALNRNLLPGNYFFWITADVSPTATVGNTIFITAPSLANVNFNFGNNFGFSLTNKTGSLTTGGIQTFQIPLPQVAINTVNIPSADIVFGTNNTPVYAFSMAVTVNPATLNAVTVPTLGTAQVNDLVPNGCKLWFNNTNNLATATQISSATLVNSGGNISFSGFTQIINAGNTGFFWVTTDVNPNATFGRTVQINLPVLTNFNFERANRTGVLAQGNVFTFIALANITLASSPVNAGNILKGTTNNLLYRFSISPSANFCVLTQVGFTLSGTFTPADFMAGRLLLWENTTDNFTTANTIASQSVGNAGAITLLNNLNRNIAVNTTNFYWLTVDVDENATTNHTISASTTLADIGFSVIVNKGGSLTAAGEQTIVPNPNLGVPHEILLPTLFSPNSDGNNDRLTVKSLNIAEIDFQVFDRFGNIVFNTKNVQEATNFGWDGGNQPSGVYFWSVKAKFTDSVVNTQRGEINLIR